MALGQFLRVDGQVGRRHVIGRRVAEVAGAILGVGDGRGPADLIRDVVMGADDQALEPAGKFGSLVTVEPVRMQERAFDETVDDGVVDVVRHLPAHGPRAEFSRPALRDRGHDACPLGVEQGSGAQPDEDEPPILGVQQGQSLVLAAALAGLQQLPQGLAGQIVGHVLAVEHADHDRVRAGLEWAGGRPFDVHRPPT